MTGKKANKESCEPIRQYLAKVVKENCFDFFVCVGDEAFKHIFGAGRKPSSVTMSGNILYCKETGSKPLFTFPSPSVLVPDLSDESTSWRNERMAKEATARFNRLFLKLKNHLKID